MPSSYRLPTEAEWVWVARFVGTGVERRYPWGDTLPPPPNAANLADAAAAGMVPGALTGYKDGHAVAAPVGQTPANPLGLHDLAGNVAEWVQDFYTIYPAGEKMLRDPQGPTSGRHHVIRGSSWKDSSETELRAAFRDYGRDARVDVGFRVARYVE